MSCIYVLGGATAIATGILWGINYWKCAPNLCSKCPTEEDSYFCFCA